MRQILTLVVLAIILCFQSCKCKLAKEETKTSGITLTELNGYFIKNTVEFTTDTMFVVLKNKADFNQYFGVAKTMSNSITKPDFEKNYIAAIVLQPSTTVRKVTLTKHHITKGTLTINYKIEEQNDQKSFQTSSLRLFEVPRNIKTIEFVCGNKANTIKL